ncbi:phytoene desaturase family protein [Aspergillus homomorphus CBS 101889]|uniref:Phytoene desaturase n=1 Tax=Aspergillus homomorphus (strain CBS 101889) TaxID=1450537 RepID=A0A395HZ46_ASPHC|nr:phytoene dehydrogenase [Aspergillus homomorphus CBS 101889]RAL12653.1 phytoene dehydrogenase [Aspergillus homomorphus CBS 101889]
MEPPTVIIVGAGAGGIATAARLAKREYKVTVVEKNEAVGGRCSLMEENGYRFDRGPSLVLMPEYFDEVFHDLDTSMSAEGVDLLKCDPNYRIYYADAAPLDLTTDLAAMQSVIEAHEGPSGFERFLQFLVESGRHYNLSRAHVLWANFPHWFSMLRPRMACNLLRLHPFESVYARAARYFTSHRLRQALTFASMYLGMNPFDAPATYSLLQYAEFAYGIWYPRGGFRTILDALTRISERHGATYRLSTPVSRITLSADNCRATGVELSTGETLTADTVIINADLIYAYTHLLPPTRYATSLTKRETSCSSITFFWSLSTTLPTLSAHNVFLPSTGEYKESFDAIFKQKHIPANPAFYIHVPSRVDPSAAPQGKDAAVVLVPVGNLGGSNATEKQTNAYWAAIVVRVRQAVLSALQDRIGVDVEPLLVSETVETPLTWQQRCNLDRGAILGLSHSFFNVLGFRPKVRHPQVKGLFFVGASTHPGTGVPVCLAGSLIVFREVVRDFERRGKGVFGVKGVGLVFVLVVLVAWLWPVDWRWV